jgi:hypothetical protein
MYIRLVERQMSQRGGHGTEFTGSFHLEELYSLTTIHQHLPMRQKSDKYKNKKLRIYCTCV